MSDLQAILAKVTSAEKIEIDWGERCPDHHEDCGCCQMWAMHDAVTALLDRIEELEGSRNGYARDSQARQVESDRWKARAEAAESRLAEARAEALEEAAAVAETGDWYGQFQTSGDERRAKAIADRIRALKSGGANG